MGAKLLLTNEQQELIRATYLTTTYDELAKSTGVSRRTIWRFINSAGLKKGKGAHSRKYEVNESYFNKWSPNMAYLLGLLLADGYIDLHNNRRRVGIALQIMDEQHIKWIRDELSPTKPLYYNTGTRSVELRIESQKLVDRLVSLGVTPNKSYNDIVPSVPMKYRYHFLRGVFDGDGCLYVKVRKRGKYISKDCCWRITAKTSNFLEELKKQTGVSEGSILSCLTWHNWQINRHKTIISLCEKIYKDKELSHYFDRKYNKYQELIRMYE